MITVIVTWNKRHKYTWPETNLPIFGHRKAGRGTSKTKGGAEHVIGLALAPQNNVQFEHVGPFVPDQ